MIKILVQKWITLWTLLSQKVKKWFYLEIGTPTLCQNTQLSQNVNNLNLYLNCCSLLISSRSLRESPQNLELWFIWLLQTIGKTLDSGVITGTSLSDHEMSFCVRKINRKKTLLQQKTFRNYANYNPEKFLKDLKNADFDLPSGNVNNKDVNELWQSFKDKFTNIAERHAPLL